MGKTRERREHYEQQCFDLDGLRRPARRLATADEVTSLQAAVEPFIDVAKLRRYVAESRDIYAALRVDSPPRELRAIMETLAAILRPVGREQIKSPADIAPLLMITMGHLTQEELRTVLLDTKSRVQDIVTVYRGSLNASMIRVGEIFKAAVRWNSAALIVAHNHPSSDPTPSPEDVLVTREILQAGKLLDIELLDHLVIGQGKWVSLREPNCYLYLLKDAECGTCRQYRLIVTNHATVW
jgi:DNA repair protein RadC